MQILTVENERLRQKAAAIPGLDGTQAGKHWEGEKWKKITQEMVSALGDEKGVGLAGPQIDLPQRVFVVSVPGDTPRVFINPSIIETSSETVKYEEGCLSVPGVWADVIRPKTVKVQAWNERGRPFTLEADGLLARVILHEYDHLEGILFIDRLSGLKKKRVLEKIAKQQARHNAKQALADRGNKE